MRGRWISILCFTLFVITISLPVYAQVLIEQGKVKLEVEPEVLTMGAITVHNTSNAPIDVKVYWNDFQYVAPFNGKKKFLPPGTNKNSLSQSMKFLPREFKLSPFGKKNIDYTVKLPPNAQGGYYGVLFVEKRSGATGEMTGVQIIARVGALFFVESIQKSKSSSLKGFKIIENGLQGDFSNKGDVILIPKGIFYLMDTEGMVVSRGELEKFYLPPGEMTPFDIKIPDDLKQGRYTAVLTFDLEDGDVIVNEIDLMKDEQSPLRILHVRD